MKSSWQKGAMNVLVVPVILLTIALMGVAGYAFVASSQAADYKNNVDQKVAAAVDEEAVKISAAKEKDFAEKEKYPYSTYVGTDATGNLKLVYPKTWSAYVIAPEGKNTSKPLEAWFHPNYVPYVSDGNNSYALRVTVTQTSYDSAVKAFQGAQKSGKVTIQPYQSANVPSLVGVRVDGEITSKKQGSMVILPFRDKTLTLWTESVDFRGDFTDIILKNFSLNP